MEHRCSNRPMNVSSSKCVQAIGHHQVYLILDFCCGTPHSPPFAGTKSMNLVKKWSNNKSIFSFLYHLTGFTVTCLWKVGHQVLSFVSSYCVKVNGTDPLHIHHTSVALFQGNHYISLLRSLFKLDRCTVSTANIRR